MSEKVVKRHEERYWHVPKFGLLPLAGLVLFAFLAWANFQGIVFLWQELELGGLMGEDITGFHQLAIIPSILLEYALASCAIVSVVALLKGGYANLKPVNEEGLIWGLEGEFK